jgi:hypothetical protein
METNSLDLHFANGQYFVNKHRKGDDGNRTDECGNQNDASITRNANNGIHIGNSRFEINSRSIGKSGPTTSAETSRVSETPEATGTRVTAGSVFLLCNKRNTRNASSISYINNS